MIDAWHIAWQTHFALPPQDVRGEWRALADTYQEVARAGWHVSFSRPLRTTYSPCSTDSVRLAPEEQAALTAWLHELTRETGDRVAGGHPVVTAAFLPTQVHIVFHCREGDLSQVVGRLKSRLATLLLLRPDRTGPRNVWGKGYWHAHLLDSEAVEHVASFVQGLNAANNRLDPTPQGGAVRPER